MNISGGESTDSSPLEISSPSDYCALDRENAVQLSVLDEVYFSWH